MTEHAIVLLPRRVNRYFCVNYIPFILARKALMKSASLFTFNLLKII